MVNELMEHAQYSPSSLELLELCPFFTQDYSRDDSAAKDGTRLHKATELEDLSLCEDEEEEEMVGRCLDYLHELIKSKKTTTLVTKEVKLKVEDITEGTGDVLIIEGTKATLIDWKFGRTPVTDAEDNIQMQGYTLGIFSEYPEVQEVEVHIVQPRLDNLSVATYGRASCDIIRERIKEVIKQCESAKKSEKPHEKCCRYCGRKAHCSAMTVTALTVGRELGLPMPTEFEPGRLALPSDRAKIQVLSYVLEDWAKKVREMNATAVIEDGIEIPGFELRTKANKSSVDDVHEAINRVLREYDVPLDRILQACSLSTTKLVDQVYANALADGRKETKKAIRENIKTLLKELMPDTGSISFLQRKRGKTDAEIIKEADGC